MLTMVLKEHIVSTCQDVTKKTLMKEEATKGGRNQKIEMAICIFKVWDTEQILM